MIHTTRHDTTWQGIAEDDRDGEGRFLKIPAVSVEDRAGSWETLRAWIR